MSNRRLNVLKRLGSSVNPRRPAVTDARQLLTRSNSDEKLVVVTGLRDTKVQNGKIVPKEVIARGSSTLVTIRNSASSTDKISFTKTIENPSAQREAEKNVVIRFVNDKFEKPAPPPPPPVVKRSNDAAIQTSSPVRSKTKKRTLDDDDDDDDEEAVKRSTTATTVRRTTAPKPNVPSGPATILVTNLQASVTEEDVTELFSEIGRINEIKTLSQGCVQVVFAKREDGEQAVVKYHNRLLDGQSMYVCLQQSPPTPQPTKPASTSNKITIDPNFFRQALFNPSNNTTNPVQFQVKL